MFCTKCGAKNPDGAKFCTTCGNPIPAFQPGPAEPVEPVERPVDPIETARPVEPAEPVVAAEPVETSETYTYTDMRSADILPADELEKRFFGKKADYYLRKLDKMTASGSNVSWNWPAFLFSYYWPFYRKLYALGGIYLGFSVLVSIVGCFVYSTAFSIVTILISLAISFFTGMFGNYLYLNHADKCLAEARQLPPQEQDAYIAKKGGTSIALAILALVVALGVSGIRSAVVYQKVYNDILAAYGISNGDNSNYGTPDPAPTTTPDPTVSTPQSTAEITYGEFIGDYVGLEATDDYLMISIDEGEFSIYQGAYRAEIYSATFYPPDNWPIIEGNQISFVSSDVDAHNVTLEYVPAAESPYGVDTIYQKIDSWDEQEVFVRSTPDTAPDTSSVGSTEGGKPSDAAIADALAEIVPPFIATPGPGTTFDWYDGSQTSGYATVYPQSTQSGAFTVSGYITIVLAKLDDGSWFAENYDPQCSISYGYADEYYNETGTQGFYLESNVAYGNGYAWTTVTPLNFAGGSDPTGNDATCYWGYSDNSEDGSVYMLTDGEQIAIYFDTQMAPVSFYLAE